MHNYHRLFKLALPVLLAAFPFTGFGQEVPPGGVPGPIYWLKTISIAPGQYTWNDAFNKRMTLSNFRQLSPRIINFNSSLFFPGTAAGQPTIDFHNLLLDQFTLAGPFYPEYASGSLEPKTGDFYQLINDGAPLFSLSANALTNQGEVLSYGQGQGQNYILKSPEALTQSMKLALVTGARLPTTVSNLWDAGHEIRLAYGFRGYAPEFVIYGRRLTKAEMQRLQSYFGIKYGLTLDTCYVNSKNEVIWNFAQNATFHHRVAAIAKDKAAALNQPFANTTDEELFQGKSSYDLDGNQNGNRSLTIGLEPDKFTRLTDKRYLFWGDDNQSINSQDFFEVDPSFKGVYIMKRQWLFQNDSLVNLPTTLIAGGSVLEQLEKKAEAEGIEPCYLLVKRTVPFKSDNIIPLVTNKTTSATWNQSNTRFTLGLVEKLRFQGKQASARVDTGRCRDIVDIIYNTAQDLSKKNNFYYFKIRGGGLIPDCVNRIVYIYDGQHLTFFLTGGVGPYTCTLSNTSAATPLSTTTLPMQTSKIYELPGALRPGKYQLTIKDQTNQVITMPVKIN